jgi:hypothetical protein
MRRSVVLLVLVCLAAARPMAAAKGHPWTLVSLMNPRATAAVMMALNGATDWLEDEGCRQIFTDFHDLSGRPLTARLAELNVDPRAFLRMIVWRDGTWAPQCQTGVLAFTAAGSRVVFVCNQHFVDLTAGDRDLASAVVLHEALHSLGLGENPPSSREITSRVRARCDGGHRESAPRIRIH